jgi:hypothetical protein
VGNHENCYRRASVRLSSRSYKPETVSGIVQGRVRVMMARWPAPVIRECRVHLRRLHETRTRSRATLPYWRELPVWLAQQNGLPISAVSDLLFAQECLFLAIRLQDDLFDRHMEPGAGVFAPTLLLLAAHNVLGARFSPADRFWREYRRLISTSLEAIVKVDRLQRAKGADWQQLRAAYIAQNSALKIGTWGVCRIAGIDTVFDAVSRFVDHLAVAGQLIDDLLDMEEDLKAGRTNIASGFMLAPSVKKSKRNSGGLALSVDRLSGYLGLLRAEVLAAGDLLQSFRLPPARRLVADHLQVITAWEHAVRRAYAVVKPADDSGRTKSVPKASHTGGRQTQL